MATEVDTIQMLNMTFDIWSAIFDLVLILGVYVSRYHNQLQARPLTLSLLSNIGVNVSEALAYCFRGDPSTLGWWMVRVSNFCVFLCNHLLMIFAAAFVFHTIEKDGHPLSAVLKGSYHSIVTLGIVLLVLSRAFGYYYAFDDQNRYFRTRGYEVMLGLLLVAMVMLLVITITNRRHLTKVERISLLTFITLPVIATVAQTFTYGISLTTFAGTISLTTMFMAYEMECSRAIIDREHHMLDEVIAALARAVDAKDPYTRGHSERVAHYARMLAERMGFDEEGMERVHRMAMLHDVGKIGVPDAVLNKPGKLTDEEFALIKSHAARGSEILSEVQSMPELATGARWHHERYDGRGYPDGISGEEIPLEARIICVADCYDAMTSDRVYRPHLSQDVVRSEVERGKGTQFDPDIAQVMLGIIDEDTDYRLHE